jgi:sodium pump decarboxylase gamma subunit
MIIGMGVVFVFLIILIIYMKFVPILSKKRKLKINKMRKNEDMDAASQLKLKLNSVLTKLSDQTTDVEGVEDGLSELKVAAIAAAIYSQTGKKPKEIVITTPSGTVERINLWGTAGRQDLMVARDMTGQVGFQY